MLGLLLFHMRIGLGLFLCVVCFFISSAFIFGIVIRQCLFIFVGFVFFSKKCVDQSFLSHFSFSSRFIAFLRTKKRKGGCSLAFLAYGCFRVTRSARTAIPMIIMMMIAMPMYSSVVCVATPLSGVAVGAGVGAVALAWK